VNARANYIIAAQDATKDAIRSIERNFKSLDGGVKATVRGINLTLGVLAGAGLKNLFRSAMDATAEATGQNSEFTKSLEEVRKAARELMVPKSGLPAVTDSMKALAATLKDPAVQSAADALFSTLLRGGAALVNVLAQTAAGLKILTTGGGNELVDIDNQILKLQGRAEFFKNDRSDSGRKKYRELQAQIAEQQMRYGMALNGDGLQPIDSEGALRGMREFADNFGDKAAADKKAIEDYNDSLKELQKTSEKLAEQGSILDAEENTDFEDQQKAREYYDKVFEDYQKRLKQSEEQTADWRDNLSEFALQAARNMQTALADFLFDPFRDGVKGMLRGFVETIRRMMAELAASKLLDVLGKSGTIGKVGNFFESLFGGFKAEGGPLQQGKWYVAGERGPEPIWGGGPGAFAMGYGGGGGGGGGGVVVHITNQVDARGATQDLAAALPAILAASNQRAVQMARAQINDDRSRRRF